MLLRWTSGRLGLLHNPNLRRLWLSEVCATSGEALGMIGLPLLIYAMTDSARMVGLITLLLVLPQVVVAPISGLLADSVDRRRLMIGSNLYRALIVAGIALSGAFWQIALLTVLLSIGNAVARPSEMAALPSIAGGDLLVRALSLFQVTYEITRIAIPAVGAALIAIRGPRGVFWLQAAAYLIAILAVRNLSLPSLGTVIPLREIARTAKKEMWAGLNAVRSVPIVRGITATEGLFQLVIGAMVVAAVVYTEETLDLGDRARSAFALLAAASSCGSLLGALVASRVEDRIGRRRMIAIGYLGPLFFTVAIFSPPMSLMYLAWFLFGMTDALAVISFQAYLAESIPAATRGRVYAAWGALIALASSIAFPVVGFLTAAFGAPVTIAGIGLLVGLGGPVLLWATGALTAIRHHVPVADLSA